MKTDYAEVIPQGRAMVRLIEAVSILLPGAGQREAEMLRDLKIMYQKRLRKMIVDLPLDISAQILVASDHISGPVGDSTLN